MKLRTRRGSIRLRLTRSEVAALAEASRVEEAVVIGPLGAALTYALVVDEAATEVTARLDGAKLEVAIPALRARAWAASSEVGIEATQGAGGEGALVILIEKDFACLKPREGEDDDDAYPHPSAGSGC